MPELAVGSIQQSLLSEAQFQAVMGTTNWVLADGQGVSGSTYQTLTGNANVPDFRGCFVRMAGGDASGVGLIQADSINSEDISVSTTVGGNSVDVGGIPISLSGSASQLSSNGGNTSSANGTATASLATATFSSGGDAIQYTAYVPRGTSGSSNVNLTSGLLNHNHPSPISGTLTVTGTTPSTIRTTSTSVRTADITAGDETRPVNIAVNYFIKIN